MKLIILSAISFLLSFKATAQSPVLHFDTTYHDFGKIYEENGPVTYQFGFTNTGTSNLILTKVVPACGCTTSKWSLDSIRPGMSGFVNATYDVVHRPGPFAKILYVFSNSGTDSIILKITGDVVRKVMTLRDSFPYQLGNLCFKTIHLNFGKLGNRSFDTSMDLFILNPSDTPITITGFDNEGSDYIHLVRLPLPVKPHSKVLLPIYYNPGKANAFGLIRNKGYLVTTDTKMPKKIIFAQADVYQYVPRLNAKELASAPRISFDKNTYDLGNVKRGDIAVKSITFKNIGKDTLLIDKLTSSYGCTISKLEKNKFEPGESANIKISFNSKNKIGKIKNLITVYTNDPINPEYVLRINSNVIVN